MWKHKAWNPLGAERDAGEWDSEKWNSSIFHTLFRYFKQKSCFPMLL